MKRYLSLAIVGVFILCASVCAAEPRLSGGYPTLTFNGTTAECSVTCSGEARDDVVEVTLTLYQGDTVVDSWSSSGLYRVLVEGECTVSRGKTYSLEMTWALNGQIQESATITRTCPWFG